MRLAWKANKSPKNVSVVGRNLLASFTLQSLLRETTAKFSWWAHENDIDFGGAWIYIPDRRMINVPLDEAIFIDPQRVFFFLNGRRVPLPEFLNFNNGPHPAIRKKTFAISLWNDVSPDLWVKGYPHSKWFEKDPISYSRFNWEGGALVPRARSLKSLEKHFNEQGVEVQGSDRSILKRLPANRILGKYAFVDKENKQHPIKKYCLWMNPAHQADGEKNVFPARWVTYTAQVDSRFVSALPLFSVWLSESEQNLFFDSGLLESSALKRVFVIPQLGSETVLLQIQNLELNPIDVIDSNDKKIDSFLWKTCPFLQEQKLKFLKQEYVEDILYSDPLPVYKKSFSNLSHYWPSSMGESHEDLKGLIKSLGPKI
jgi:hypothetical protein